MIANIALTLISSLIMMGTQIETSSAADQKWTSIFNGNNLEGWKIKFRDSKLGENYKDTFRVKDGILTANYDQYETFDKNFGHLFYHKKLSNYILRLDYRFTGDLTPGSPGWAYRNSGIMVHSQSPESMKFDQSFPTSIEVQILGGREEGSRPTGNVCTPAPILRSSPNWKQNIVLTQHHKPIAATNG